MEKGMIYSNEEASELYGGVKSSLRIDTSQIRNLLEKTKNNFMLKLKDDSELIILGDKRKPLYPSDYKVLKDEVFSSFSKSRVTELLSKGSNKTTNIEIRSENILTVSNGEYTLELSWPCPPYCD
jgi:hypothetical protein